MVDFLYGNKLNNEIMVQYIDEGKINETKEVDLEKELGKYLDANDIEFSHQIKLLDFAKHFYELGISVSDKAQKGK